MLTSRCTGLVASCCFSAATPAAAEIFCVDTEASLQAALDTAADNGEADAIRIRSGTIALGTGLYYSTMGGDHEPLSVRGGYAPGCSGRRGSTWLDGQGKVRVLNLFLAGADAVFLYNLNLMGGDSGESLGGNLSAIMNDPTGGAILLLENSRVMFGSSGAAGAGASVSGWGWVVLRNNLFLGNMGSTAPALSIGFDGIAHVTSNTITGNIASGGGGFAAYAYTVTASPHFWFSNNILWGNDVPNEDLYLIGPGQFDLIHNNIGSVTDIDLGSESGGNLSVDPQFADCGLFCFERPLLRSSPLVDAGRDDPPEGLSAHDLFGVDRTVGAHVDIGAYELERLFADGFENGTLLLAPGTRAH